MDLFSRFRKERSLTPEDLDKFISKVIPVCLLLFAKATPKRIQDRFGKSISAVASKRLSEVKGLSAAEYASVVGFSCGILLGGNEALISSNAWDKAKDLTYAFTIGRPLLLMSAAGAGLVAGFASRGEEGKKLLNEFLVDITEDDATEVASKLYMAIMLGFDYFNPKTFREILLNMLEDTIAYDPLTAFASRIAILTSATLGDKKLMKALPLAVYIALGMSVFSTAGFYGLVLHERRALDRIPDVVKDLADIIPIQELVDTKNYSKYII